LDYKQFGGWARKVKFDWNKRLRAIEGPPSVTEQGRPLRVLPSSHHVEFSGPVPAELIELLRLVEDDRGGFNKWYRSPNRNRQWCFRGSDVVVYVFPKSETCRLRMVRPMQWCAFRDAIEQAFSRLFPAEASNRLYNLLFHFANDLIEDVSAQHRIFPVGYVSPFQIPYYRDSHGLTITADGSDPGYIEVLEKAPPWIRPFVRELVRRDAAVEKSLGKIGGELMKLGGLLEKQYEVENKRLELEQAVLGSWNGSAPDHPKRLKDKKPDSRQFS
jgi:hypothetical protein